MTRPSLAGIEQRGAAATEGPWVTWEADATFVTHPDKTSDELGFWIAEGYEEPDAALIAHTRTDLPALTAAVRDVLALHTDGGQSQGYTDDAPGGYGYIDHCCAECGSFGEFGEPYPCATVRALAAHLDLTDPEGDPT